jgi:hypothetical protein
MAIATAMLIPSVGFDKPLMKVARPSGKLWMAMASAENTPIRISLALSCSLLVAIFRCTFNSWGFSYDGTNSSMIPISNIPAKKDITVNIYPCFSPSPIDSESLAFTNISTKET